jgi:hypothetical protein
MEHIPIELICRIADGDVPPDEIAAYLTHLESCRVCEKEIELQRSMLKISQKVPLINPGSNFTGNIIDIISPSKKKWYERFFLNISNVIAMASVLAFIGYVYSITDAGGFQANLKATSGPVSNFFKIFQDGSRLIGSYLTSKISLQSIGLSNLNTIVFALLAIILLIFTDKIIQHFLNRQKI